MSYRKTRIYFMSGTGNSYRVAEWMGEAARAAGAETRVVPLDGAKPREEIEASPDNLVGLVTPTHGFTAPWHVIRFALKLPRRRGAHAFVVPTRAGGKFGPLFTPGIAGSTAFLLAIILALKGYRVRGAMSLDMPSNWMSLHPAFKPKNSRAINARSRPLAEGFIKRILSGRLYWFSINNLYEILWAVMLLEISILYLLIGRFCLAKMFFANHRCTGCGLCAEACPVGAIRMVGRERKLPYWRYNCESCMRCMGFCPEEAVEASQPWAVVLTAVTIVVFSYISLSLFAGLIPGINALAHTPADLLFQAVVMDIAFVLAYFLLHPLARVPFFNAILTYSTGTHYYRRHREPDTKLGDLLPRGSKGAEAENPRIEKD